MIPLPRAGAGPGTGADTVFLNIRERAPKLATIRSFGWRDSALARSHPQPLGQKVAGIVRSVKA